MNRRQLQQAARMNRRALDLYARLGRTVRCVDVRDWGDLSFTRRGEPLLPRQLAAECGTDAGYNRHRRNGETACNACKEAHAERARSGVGTRLGRVAA